jgi:hypothetical protein
MRYWPSEVGKRFEFAPVPVPVMRVKKQSLPSSLHSSEIYRTPLTVYTTGFKAENPEHLYVPKQETEHLEVHQTSATPISISVTPPKNVEDREIPVAKQNVVYSPKVEEISIENERVSKNIEFATTVKK